MKHQLWLNRKLSNWAWTKDAKIQIVFFRNCLRKFGKFRFKKARTVNVLYFYLDPGLTYPGLADRIKTMINCFYIAEQNGYDYKIIFQSPFQLSKYLQPNEIKWEATESELDFSFTDTRFLNYHGKFRSLSPRKQYICFNFMDKGMPELMDRDDLWRNMFQRLFKFSPAIEKTCSETGYAPYSYIAIHLRFVNALGETEIGKKALPQDKQQDLIRRCREGIMLICKENREHLPVLIFSDNSKFLKLIDDLPVHNLGSDNIRHLGYAEDSQDVMKTFVDLVMLGRARKIYRILAPEMFPTMFSIIAARIGDVECSDINV